MRSSAERVSIPPMARFPIEEIAELDIEDEPNGNNASAPRRRGRLPSVSPEARWPVYAGLGVAAIGFVLIAYAWARVAGLASVALQVPYIVSGGLVGLALVVIGAVGVALWSRHQEAATRERQLDHLGQVLTDIRELLRKGEP